MVTLSSADKALDPRRLRNCMRKRSMGVPRMVRSKRHLKSTLEGGRQEEGLGKLRGGIAWTSLELMMDQKIVRKRNREAGIRRLMSVWNGKGGRRYVWSAVQKEEERILLQISQF